MRRKALSKLQENSICAQHAEGYPQKQIALNIGCSPRTVGRVLVARGVATAVPRLQDEARQVMKLLKKHDINPKELELILKDHKSGQAPLNFSDPTVLKPVKERVQEYLNKAPHAELALLFYHAALAKVAETHNKHLTAAKTAASQTKIKKEPVNYGHQHYYFPSYQPK
ncbi:MAG TPA: hypothetical protein VM783_07830 [Candidatus Acidoferrum sp.]|nr:hypothetical protein [Candidatus Acidoferrum sp.]